jgi:hypothetical protein
LSSLADQLEVRELSTAACFGAFSTLYLTYISSANDAQKRASGIFVSRQSDSSLRFCTISQQVPANCVLLHDSILSSNVSCIAFIGIGCRSVSTNPGLVLLLSIVTPSSCVFQLNTFDYFLGPYWKTRAGSIFIERVFDLQSPDKSRPMSIAMGDCLYLTERMSPSEILSDNEIYVKFSFQQNLHTIIARNLHTSLAIPRTLSCLSPDPAS